MKRSALPLSPAALTAVCAGILLAMLPHWPRLPLWIPVLALACVGWRLGMAWRGWPVIRPTPRIALTLFAVLGVWMHYGNVFGGEAGAALLAVMLALKLLELRRMRDAVLTAGLGYFLVVTQFLFSQGVTTACLMLASVVTTTTALIMLQDPDRHVGVRRAARQSAALLLQAAPLMIVMFVLFPRLASPMWGVPELEDAGQTGVGDEMSPGSISQLFIDDSPAFRVTFRAEPPSTDSMYWRGPVLWQYDGQTWTRGQSFGYQRPVLEQPRNHVEYEVNLEPHKRHWLFALDMPVNRPRGAFVTGNFEVVKRDRVDELMSYDMRSALGYVANPELSPSARLAALQLPDGFNPRTRELVDTWRTETETGQALVNRALNHFNEESFVYTLQPEPLGRHTVDEFLFDTRRGYCEHYASSFVFLMRAAGVPARVVTGYQGGHYNRLGDYLLVRQSDAHAWAEVWLEGGGWVRVDPTSSVDPSRVELGGTADAGNRSGWGRFSGILMSWDALQNAWNRWVLSYDSQRQSDLLQRMGMNRQRWGEELLFSSALLTALALGTAFALYSGRYRRRSRAEAAWHRFRRKLARAGLAPSVSTGPVDLTERAAAAWPDQAGTLREIQSAYVTYRYMPRPSEDALVRLESAVRRLHLRPRREPVYS